VRDDDSNDLRFCEQLIHSQRETKPNLWCHLWAWNVGNLLDLNLRDLLDRWYGRDEVFARKSGYIASFDWVLLAGNRATCGKNPHLRQFLTECEDTHHRQQKQADRGPHRAMLATHTVPESFSICFQR